MEKSVTYLEVEILFNNGTKDWISPIEDMENISLNNDNELEIYNGYNTYRYSIENISKVDIVKMFDHEEIERESLYNFE